MIAVKRQPSPKTASGIGSFGQRGNDPPNQAIPKKAASGNQNKKKPLVLTGKGKRLEAGKPEYAPVYHCLVRFPSPVLPGSGS